MATTRVAGVDWASAGWLAVFFENGSYDTYAFKHRFADLWEDGGLPDTVLVDVPIGLPEDDTSLRAREELDSLARTVTGRPSSVFPVPSREACRLATEDDADYEVVVDQNKEDLEKGLSWQSYYIAEGIGEVDAFLRRSGDHSERIIESHPEVCFRALLGDQLAYGKTTAPGVGERLDAMQSILDAPGRTLAKLTSQLRGEPSDIDIDDVLDALVLGATASKGTGAFEYLPPEPVEDPREIPMRMAYWGPEPLA